MGGPKDPFDDDYPTQRHSGSLQRGPIWEGFARVLVAHMLDVEARCKTEIDRLPVPHSGFGEATRALVSARLESRILEARSIAEEARHLAGAFKSWERHDPGAESRAATLERWHDLERRAKDFEARERS